MENLSKISKFILYLTAIAFTVFVGSYTVKLFVISQFFTAETMELKNQFSNYDLRALTESTLPVFGLSFVSYVSFLLLFTLFLLLTKPSLKKYGWLFIITVIIYFTAIFEVLLIFQFDIEIITQLYGETTDGSHIINLFRGKLTEFGPFPLLLLFSYLVIMFLVIYKPLQKSE